MIKIILLIALIFMAISFIKEWLSLRVLIYIMISKGIEEPGEHEFKIATTQVIRNLSNDVKRFLKL